MGRFSSFISKAGDVVQQANEEYQRARQQQQQAQSRQQYGARGHEPVQQYSGSYDSYRRDSLHNANLPPPPLPPRQTPTSPVHQPAPPYYYPVNQPYPGQNYAPVDNRSSYVPSAGYHGSEENPQLMRQRLEEQLRREQQEASRIRQELELQLEEGRKERERLQLEYATQLELVQREVESQRRQYGDLQQAQRESANASMAELTAQADEEMRRAQDMLSQQTAQYAVEMKNAESVATEQRLQFEHDMRDADRRGAGAGEQAQPRAPEKPQANTWEGNAYGEDDVHRGEVDDELSKQIQELLITQSASPPPPPPPPRPSYYAQTHAGPPAVAQQPSNAMAEPAASSPIRLAPAPSNSTLSQPNVTTSGTQQEASSFPPSPSFPPPPTEETRKLPDKQTIPAQTRDPQFASRPDARPTAPRPSRAPTITTTHVSGITPVVECIGTPVKLDVDWFFHGSAPEFLVCSRCFVDHIYNTELRDMFTHYRFKDFDTVPRRCFFGSTRVQKALWPAAVSQHSLEPMLGYMKSRPQIGQCPEMTPQESREWWVAADIPGLSICQACYEDDIVTGPFVSHFRREKLNKGYICDASLWFVKRMYTMHSEKNDWETFAGECKDRLQIPICPKLQPVAGTERTWLTSKRAPDGLQICYACYGDYFYGTPNADYFQHLPRNSEKTVCLFGHLNFLLPAQQAISKKDPDLFWRCVEAVDKQPLCGGKGITGATWYTLPNNPPEFVICGGCYAGVAEPFGWSRHLVRKKNVSPSQTLLCCFNPAHARFGRYMTLFFSCLFTDSWKLMGEYAAAFANVPVCPRSSTNTPPNRRYWGWDSLHICEECYLSFARGTVLEPEFDMKGEVINKSRLCDIYSPRMRGLYQDACDGRATLGELLSFAHQRRVIYIQTVPECERLLNQQKIMAQEAQMLGIMGTAYKSMGGSLDAVTGHSYTVGNAYVGHGYANHMLLEGAVYDKQSRELAAGVTSGSVLLQIQMLEQRWRAVE